MPETSATTTSTPDTVSDPDTAFDPDSVNGPPPKDTPSAEAATPPMELMSTGQRILVTGFNFVTLLGPAIYVLTYLQEKELNQQSSMGTVLILACLIGFSMGSLHGLASIAAHAGGRRLGSSWVLYYLIRPVVGAGIALVTCLILMSGIGGFKVGWQQDPLPLFAWAALAGLYSQPAMEKLKELFATLFRTAGSGRRGRRPAGAS